MLDVFEQHIQAVQKLKKATQAVEETYSDVVKLSSKSIINMTAYNPTQEVEEKIIDNLDLNAPQNTWGWIQANALLEKIGVESPTRSEQMAAAKLIRRINGNISKRSVGKTLLFTPPLKHK